MDFRKGGDSQFDCIFVCVMLGDYPDICEMISLIIFFEKAVLIKIHLYGNVAKCLPIVLPSLHIRKVFKLVNF